MSRLNPANITSWTVDDVSFWLVQQVRKLHVYTYGDTVRFPPILDDTVVYQLLVSIRTQQLLVSVALVE